MSKSIAEYLESAGYKVYGTSRNPQRYPDSKVELVQWMSRIKIVSWSIHYHLLSKNPRIDILINNAGIRESRVP
jgi:NADP-dependent 3-hydroxy acid dehydrogenase YdfG